MLSHYRNLSDVSYRPTQLVIVLSASSLFFTLQIGLILGFIVLLSKNKNNPQLFVWFVVILILLLSVYPIYSIWSLYAAFKLSPWQVRKIFFKIICVVSVISCLSAIGFCLFHYYFSNNYNNNNNNTSNKDFYFTYLNCILVYSTFNLICVFVASYLKHRRLMRYIQSRKENRYPIIRPRPVNSQGKKWIIVNQMEWIPLLLDYNEKVRKQLMDFYNDEIQLDSSSNLFYIDYKLRSLATAIPIPTDTETTTDTGTNTNTNIAIKTNNIDNAADITSNSKYYFALDLWLIVIDYVLPYEPNIELYVTGCEIFKRNRIMQGDDVLALHNPFPTPRLRLRVPLPPRVRTSLEMSHDIPQVPIENRLLTIVPKKTFAYYLKQVETEWSKKKYLDYIEQLVNKSPKDPNLACDDDDNNNNLEMYHINHPNGNNRNNRNNRNTNRLNEHFGFTMCRIEFIPLFSACLHLISIVIGFICIGMIDINNIVLCYYLSFMAFIKLIDICYLPVTHQMSSNIVQKLFGICVNGSRCCEKYAFTEIERYYDADGLDKESKKAIVEEFIKSYDNNNYNDTNAHVENIINIDNGDQEKENDLFLDHSTTVVKKKLDPNFMSDNKNPDGVADINVESNDQLVAFEYHQNDFMLEISQNDKASDHDQLNLTKYNFNSSIDT